MNEARTQALRESYERMSQEDLRELCEGLRGQAERVQDTLAEIQAELSLAEQVDDEKFKDALTKVYFGGVSPLTQLDAMIRGFSEKP